MDEKIKGTLISTPINPITHITVREVGRFAFTDVSFMIFGRTSSKGGMGNARAGIIARGDGNGEEDRIDG
jgi:hypothetical protein